MSKIKTAAKKAVDAVAKAVSGSPAAPPSPNDGGCNHDFHFVGIDCHRRKFACSKCPAVEFRGETA